MIQDILGDIIKLEIPSFPDYIQSRMQQSESLAEVTKAILKEDAENFMISTPILDEEEFNELMIDEEGENEKKVKLEILDVAGVFHYANENQDKFFDALAASSKTEYFTLKSI